MLEAALEKTGSDAEAARVELEATAEHREEAEAARREVGVLEASLAGGGPEPKLEQNIRQLAATDEALEVARRETEEARTQIAAAESAAAASTSEIAARIEELEAELAAARAEHEALTKHLENEGQRAPRGARGHLGPARQGPRGPP